MRVLVAEDVRRLADDIAEGLRDEAMAVDVAYDGLEAAAKLDLNRYDVVVLDRDLPGLHGDMLCRMIIEGDDPAMVLMLTASGTPYDRVAGLRLVADPDRLTRLDQNRVLTALTKVELPGAPMASCCVPPVEDGIVVRDG